MPGTYKKNINTKRRKGSLAVILPWLRRFGLALVVLTVLSWTGAWFFLSDADTKSADWVRQKIILATAESGFVVDDVLVEGRVHSDADVLRALINMEKGDPLFAFTPAEAQDLIERIGWVKKAHVERRLPGTIYVRLQERIPTALWRQGDGLALIDEDGEVITTQNLGAFKDLIILSGDGAEKAAPALLKDLKEESDVLSRVKAAQRIGQRRWDLAMKSKVVVKLPELNQSDALKRLSHAHRQDGLLDRDIKSLDLREDEKIVIQTRPGAVQQYKAGLSAEDSI